MNVIANKFTNVKTLAERLKHARITRGLTQAELAKAAHCSPGTIGNAEASTRSSLREIVLVARVLRISADWLFDGTGKSGLPDEDAAGDQAIQANPLRATEPVAAFDAAQRWPFATIRRSDITALSASQLSRLEKTMASRIQELQDDAGTANRRTA